MKGRQMKIVVYNSYEQYALSRTEVEIIREVLPLKAWARVRKLHLAHSHPHKAEVFEFDTETGIAYLIAPVKEKTSAIREGAVRELLLGLARVSAHSRFFLPLKASERASYEGFVAEWLPKCLEAIERRRA